MKTLIALIRSLRPHQWVKNSFVLAPLVFSLNVDEPAMLLRAGLATASRASTRAVIHLVFMALCPSSQHPAANRFRK